MKKLKKRLADIEKRTDEVMKREQKIDAKACLLNAKESQVKASYEKQIKELKNTIKIQSNRIIEANKAKDNIAAKLMKAEAVNQDLKEKNRKRTKQLERAKK